MLTGFRFNGIKDIHEGQGHTPAGYFWTGNYDYYVWTQIMDFPLKTRWVCENTMSPNKESFWIVVSRMPMFSESTWPKKFAYHIWTLICIDQKLEQCLILWTDAHTNLNHMALTVWSGDVTLPWTWTWIKWIVSTRNSYCCNISSTVCNLACTSRRTCVLLCIHSSVYIGTYVLIRIYLSSVNNVHVSICWPSYYKQV